MAHVLPRELDLSHYGHDNIMDKINISAVPGLKTSTAFFTFLRANLNVNPSAMSSNTNTPLLQPTSPPATLPPPSPSPLITMDSPPVASNLEPVPDDLPPLSCGILTTEVDKLDALNLVTDSIAQQRQTSSLNLVFHPYLLPVLIAALGMAFQYSWRMKRDLGLALMLHSGVVMTYLLGIRYMTGSYISIAESMRWDWMLSEDGEEDTVVGVRFGKEIIGALMLRLEPSSNPTGKKRTRASALRGGKGVIRAWTVKLRFRGKGVGTDMLQEAVKITKEKCGRDAAVGFAKEHANSEVVLPEVLNGQMRKGEQRAAKTLEKVVFEWEEARRHKRGNSR
ncbi:acetyltransferase [Seiridium cupressi]